MGMILSHSNVQVSVTAYSDIHFGVQLQEVFTYMFTCASHQPAAFCKYLIYATYSFHCLSTNVIIHKKSTQIASPAMTRPMAEQELWIAAGADIRNCNLFCGDSCLTHNAVIRIP